MELRFRHRGALATTALPEARFCQVIPGPQGSKSIPSLGVLALRPVLSTGNYWGPRGLKSSTQQLSISVSVFSVKSP